MNRPIESLVSNLLWSVDHDDEIDRAMLEVEAVSGKDSMNRAITGFFQNIFILPCQGRFKTL